MGAAVQVQGELAVVVWRQAQQPVAAFLLGGLAQQHVQRVVVGRIGEEVRTPLVQRQQLVQPLPVRAAGQAVGAQLPGAVQPGQALQVGQALAQGIHQAGHGCGRRRVDVGLYHIQRLLGLERHVQVQVVGHFHAGIQALRAQVGLGVVELGEQLPQQQAQQDQGQQRQRALDRPAQGRGGCFRRGTQ